jgi:hypothetical protein
VKQKDNCVNGIVQKQLELAKRVNKNAIFHMIYVEEETVQRIGHKRPLADFFVTIFQYEINGVSEILT